MKVDERMGTLDEVRSTIAEPVRPVFDALLALAETVDPDSLLTASPREKSVYIGLGRGKMTDGYAYVMGHKSHANLGFFRGTELADPDALLEGSGKRLRHVKVRDVGAAASPAVRRLLEAARDHMLELKGRP